MRSFNALSLDQLSCTNCARPTDVCGECESEKLLIDLPYDKKVRGRSYAYFYPREKYWKDDSEPKPKKYLLLLSLRWNGK